MWICVNPAKKIDFVSKHCVSCLIEISISSCCTLQFLHVSLVCHYLKYKGQTFLPYVWQHFVEIQDKKTE